MASKIGSEEKQPFLSHLEELRKRLIVCAIGVGCAFFVAYFFKEGLFKLLVLPLKDVMPAGDRLIFTNLPEMFIIYLKVSFIAGILASTPLIFYELWMFIAPGLYQHEQRFVIPFVVCSSILFTTGALFGYFIVFPFGFKFLMGYTNEYVKALPSVKEYFSFSTKLLFAFGLVFEMPVIVFFLAKMGLVTPEAMRRKRKYAVLMAFVVGAILTPPDVLTQFMMAVPLMVLYEVSVFVAKFAAKKKKEKAEAEAGEAGAVKEQ
jgi:sec-independent protein translocase protein TatC